MVIPDLDVYNSWCRYLHHVRYKIVLVPVPIAVGRWQRDGVNDRTVRNSQTLDSMPGVIPPVAQGIAKTCRRDERGTG